MTVRRTRRRQFWLSYFVPALILTSVAATQWVRVDTHAQSPWIGAGFGMFATVDGADRVVVLRSARTGERLATPSELLSRYGAVAAIPTDPTLRGFANDAARITGAPVKAEVWAPEFDGSADLVTWRLIAASSSDSSHGT